jgi:hypothetical protein
VTYPVARMRSMISRMLRRYALWVGSDRPTPRGSGEPGVGEPTIDDVLGVVARELIGETEDALLLWCSEDIGPQYGSRQVGFIYTQTRAGLE